MTDLELFNKDKLSETVSNPAKAIRGKIRIYACGGAAIAIVGKNFHNYSPNEDQADLDIVYIDSSYSNISKIPTSVTKNRFYHIHDPSKGADETDGGGKDRALMVPVVRPHLPKIVEVFAPLELNLVVCSGGGATGSTSGPMLAKELIDRGESVTLLMVGCEDSEISTRNTVNTWRSIEQMVKSTDKDWAVFYTHNTRYDDAGKLVKNSQDKSDKAIVNAIVAFAHLGSRRNEGLDTMDVHKAINLSSALRIETGLALVTIHTTNQSIGDYEYHVDGLLSLYSNTREEIDVTPSYDGYGITKSNFSAESGIEALHFAFSRQAVFPLFEKIRSIAEKLNSERTSAVGLSSISKQTIGRVTDVTDGDMIV